MSGDLIQCGMTHLQIIADCMCRSDGIDPRDGTLVFDERGKRVSAREWYDECAKIMVEALAAQGFQIVHDGRAA